MGDLIAGKWDVRCSRPVKTTGVQCRNRAVPGSTACKLHGGREKRSPEELLADPNLADPKTRTIAARARLEELVEDALKAVVDVMKDPMSDAKDRLKAAEMVLDRTVGRKAEVHVTSHAERDLDDELDQLLGGAGEAAAG